MPDVIIFNAFGADFAGLLPTCAAALREAEGVVHSNERNQPFAGVNDINVPRATLYKWIYIIHTTADRILD